MSSSAKRLEDEGLTGNMTAAGIDEFTDDIADAVQLIESAERTWPEPDKPNA